MDKAKEASLDYLISRGLITKEEWDTIRPEQIFKLIKSKRKHQLKSLEVLAAKVLAGQN